MIALMLSLVVTIAAGVLSMELWGWLPTVSRWLIRLVTLSLPRERRALRRREFREELRGHYAERRVAGLAWTLRLAPICVWERASMITLERWGNRVGWCLTGLSLVYLGVSQPETLANTAQNTVLVGGLLHLYLRHNRSFYFVRSMFLVVVGVGAVHALAELAVARPFLVSEAFMEAALKTACALLIAWPTARLTRTRAIRAVWVAYPIGLVIPALLASSSNVPPMTLITGAILSAIAAYSSRGIHRLRQG